MCSTPVSLQHSKLSLLYRQLAQQLAAGLTLAQALRAPSPAPAGDSFRLAAMAEGGASVAQVMAAAGAWLPETDRPFLVAAAASGRLPLVLANLAERHTQISVTQKRVVLACIYPVGVFQFAAVLVPFLRMIDFEKGLCWSTAGYLGGLAAILVPVWGGAIALWILVKRENPLALGLLGMMPAIGGYRKHQALADFSFALGNLLEAGAPIGQAWLDAGVISRSGKVRRAAARMHQRIDGGLSPSAHLAESGVFSEEFMARYRTGEMTGSLEASLLALAADHQAKANQRLVAASMLYPGLLFAAVAAMVGYIVIGFVLTYVRTLEGLM